MGKRVMELRWDPTLGEWVMVSNVRELRPWRSGGGCPFCPGSPEVPEDASAPLVLENRYPMLAPNPPEVEVGEYPLVKAPARGKCYVIIESLKHSLPDISSLNPDGIAEVLEEVGRLTMRARGEGYAYLLWFRNRGEEVGVSLTHPHSQVYVTPFVPSRVCREDASARRYFRRFGRCLFCDILKAELSEGLRIVCLGSSSVAFVPFYAHWPFETHVYVRRHVQYFSDLSRGEVRDLARTLKKVLAGMDEVFGRPMPYVLAAHQAPLRGEHPHYHLHIEVYGMLRASGRLKYAAGMEQGGGNFTYDSTPEHVASMLREKIRALDAG